MKEFNFKITVIETGWIEVHANNEQQAKLNLKTKYKDKFDLQENMKWREGMIEKIELQTENRTKDVTHLYLY